MGTDIGNHLPFFFFFFLNKVFYSPGFMVPCQAFNLHLSSVPVGGRAPECVGFRRVCPAGGPWREGSGCGQFCRITRFLNCRHLRKGSQANLWDPGLELLRVS